MASVNTNHCYICGQDRPCCRQVRHDVIGRHDQKIVREITGELQEKWAYGSVYVTCCGAIYGEFFDLEDMCWKTAFLGDTEEQANACVNIVKANI